MHPFRDYFAAQGVGDDGPVWHRCASFDSFEPERVTRGHFWCHDALGQEPYYAVMDDFGNLARVTLINPPRFAGAALEK